MTEITVEQAQAAVKAARDELDAAHTARRDALNEAERATGPRLHAARVAHNDAEAALASAVRAATPDHPMHGKRVYRMKPTRSRQFMSKPDGEQRIDGVVGTYRPGDAKPTYGFVRVGDALVFPLLKSGKPAKKPELYEDLGGRVPWLPTHSEAEV